MGLRRKASARREPRFDAFPIPAFGLRLTARDRPAAPPADETARRAPAARKERRQPKEEARPRARHNEEEPEPPPPRRHAGDGGGNRRSFFARLAYWGVVLGIWAILAAVGLFVWTAAHLPAIQSLEVPKRPPAIQILGLNGRTLATRGDMGGAAVALKDLPSYLPQAFLAIEDRRFYKHHGIDLSGIARAVVANVMRRNVSQGGSTLTQQLAKNLFLTQARTFDRKIQELVLALWLEHKFTKAEIFELYLNRIYFGAGAYGVEAAAQRYFGKSARQVTLAEAAMLAGLVKSPSRLSPARNPDGAERRAHVVLMAMVDAGFLSEKLAKAALAQEPRILKATAGGSVNYVADWIMDVVNDLIGRVEQDIVVETSIDPALQTAAEKALIEELAHKGDKFAVGQGAILAMSPDGAVRALVGGRNYADSQFNRAIAAKRQPGSAFKPFVFLAALERGLTPDTIREDRPIAVKGWRPENYTREYFGPVTLTRALAHSLNTVAVRLVLEVGPKAVVRTAHRLGIASPLNPNASIALGTSEVSVIELVSAFAPFANGGMAITPRVVEQVRSVGGKTLYRRVPESLGRIVDERHVAMMNVMMRETLASGTAHKADFSGLPAAGKTGTSQDFRDAWFIGYTSHLVTGVWLGNDDNSPTRKTTGGGLPVEIWSRFMKAAHQGIVVAELPGLRGGAAAPMPAATAAIRPPAAAAEPGRPLPPDGATLDRWFIDRLFGRR
ncbi:MAG: transglycosylase domain-containing protein [Xanthobacteraceae bacterium]